MLPNIKIIMTIWMNLVVLIILMFYHYQLSVCNY